MDIAKIKQLLQKELNDRRVYEDAFDAVQSLEGLLQNQREIAASIDALKKEHAKQAAENGKMLESIDTMAKQAKEIQSAAQKNAASIVSEAKEKASEIVKKADAKMAKLESDAKKKETELSELVMKISEMTSDHEKIKAALAQSKEHLKGLLQ